MRSFCLLIYVATFLLSLPVWASQVQGATPDASAPATTAVTPAPTAVTTPAQTVRRVLVVSIDGLRPDLMLLADCPTIRLLIRDGSYSFWAKTTEMGVTLPSHTSMVTGREIVYHGIHWNGNTVPDGVEYQYPQVPTLFELAKEHGMSTAIVSGKAKFRYLARPGSVDYLSVPSDPKISDEQTVDNAVRIIREHQPDVMLLHLPDVDTVGHRDGWGTPEQLAAIERADAALARALDALDAAGHRDDTLIILNADHGGWWKSHNGGDPRGRHIPWIVVGPGVRKNYDLNCERDLEIQIYDTFATACQYLGIPLPEKCQGKPVNAAFIEPD
ncbi:MAG: alkaline phosphatase family protein [Phycisphaerales bacterium]